MKKDQIRKVVDVIYDEVFNQGQADLYPGLVSGHYHVENWLTALQQISK